MPTIPALATIGGEITDSPHNNNYSTIRTYVNDYCAFKDVANTFTASQTVTGNILTGAHNTYSLGATGTRFSNIYAQGAIYTATRFYVDGTISSFTNGSLYRDSTYGFLLAGVTGSTADAAITDNAGNPRLQVLTSTGVVSCTAGLTAAGVTSTNGLTVSSGTSALQAVTCTTIAPSGTATLQAATCTSLTASTIASGNTAITGTLTVSSTINGQTISSAASLTGTLAVAGVATFSATVAAGPSTALSSSATAGFLWIPATNGVPSGTPSPEYGDRIALTYNYSANALYAYNPTDNTWRAV